MAWDFVGIVFCGFKLTNQQLKIVQQIWDQEHDPVPDWMDHQVKIWQFCGEHYAALWTMTHMHTHIPKNLSIDPEEEGFVEEITKEQLYELNGTDFTETVLSYVNRVDVKWADQIFDCIAALNLDDLEQCLVRDTQSFWEDIPDIPRATHFDNTIPQVKLFNTLTISY